MILQTDPIEYVEDICENMQLFPKEDFSLNRGDQLMFEFKPEVVAHQMQHWIWLQVFEKLFVHACVKTQSFSFFFC